MTNLKDLASKNGLDTINVNNGVNNAIIGFSSFTEAKDFADEHNMRVVSFKNVGGTSNSYEVYDDSPRAAFDVLSHYEDYTKFFKGDEDEFQSVDINEVLENNEFSSEQEKSEWLEEMQAVKTRIANLKDGEFIYLDNSGVYSDVLKVEDTFDTHNGNSYVIGVYE
jgi:hypothetical protein